MVVHECFRPGDHGVHKPPSLRLLTMSPCVYSGDLIDRIPSEDRELIHQIENAI